MDDAQTGAMKTYCTMYRQVVILLGSHAGSLPHVSPHYYQ